MLLGHVFEKRDSGFNDVWLQKDLVDDGFDGTGRDEFLEIVDGEAECGGKA